MKTAFRLVKDIFEFYIPVLSFFIMFAAFLVQVFFRYAMRHPLFWTQEVIVMSFIWTVVLGSCYTMRKRSHVTFTMIYDRLSPRPAASFRLLGNLIVAVTFLLLVVPSYNYSFFLGFQKTAVFRIPFTVMFLSFAYFLCSVVGYTAVDIIEDVKVLLGRIPDSRDHAAGRAKP
ncbi:MAG: TRAP transporter small permease subunit [Planctomycetota bacterium]|nr:TRAP transporter small permease subunit [Planctomycetota bacterium]